ncbi:MAG: isocitrate lyase/PEP mutase family protein [Paracoccaceae bacterium]
MTESFNQSCPPGLRAEGGRNAVLRARLSEGLLIAPGCFDCLTARLVEQAGFDAAYVTGAGMSMSMLGAPDLGLASFSEVLDRISRICDVLGIPVIADGDTGFGGPLNIIRTVRAYERAGVSAIQIEDQESPKRCGHESGRRVVPVAEMQARIRAAVDARLESDFVVIARTDARSALGLAEAIDRAGAWREAGADIVFVESPESVEELKAVKAALPDVPLVANMVEGGRTPCLDAETLEALGYALAIFPNSLTRLFAKAGQDMLAEMKRHGGTATVRDSMLGHDALWQVFERDTWLRLERRYQQASRAEAAE